MTRPHAARDLVSQSSGWFSTLDSRPHEKRLVVGASLAGALACWFAVAWRYPLLVAALPLIAGATLALIRAQRWLGAVRARGTHEADEEEAGRNLLARLNLSPPPVPVGRTGPDYELPADRWEPPAREAEDEEAESEAEAEPGEEANEDEPDPSAAVSAASEVEPQLEVEPQPELEPDHEESDSLLDRLTFALPPAPVGRTVPAAAPEPELESEPEPLSGDRIYEVCETVAGRSIVRHRSLSLFAATDFALDLHLQSQGGDIVVARVRGDERQTVLSFDRERPPEGASSGKTLLETFGYPVTRWRGPTV